MSIRGDAEATSPCRLRLAQGLRLRLSKGVWRTSSWCVSGEPARLVEECLVPLLRVWDLPDEIDFASLPSRLETKLQAASRLGKGVFLCVRLTLILAEAQHVPGAARQGLRRLADHHLTRHQRLHVPDRPRPGEQ